MPNGIWGRRAPGSGARQSRRTEEVSFSASGENSSSSYRSLRELLDVVELLKQRGVALVSLEEKIDTSSAAGELVVHVFGSIAQFERRLIAERTRDGIAAARAEGRKPGRPALDQEKVRAALTLVRSGLSPTKAADQVGLGRSTVYRELALLTGVTRPSA